jgi:hypothetical protein
LACDVQAASHPDVSEKYLVGSDAICCIVEQEEITGTSVVQRLGPVAVASARHSPAAAQRLPIVERLSRRLAPAFEIPVDFDRRQSWFEDSRGPSARRLALSDTAFPVIYSANLSDEGYAVSTANRALRTAAERA